MSNLFVSLHLAAWSVAEVVQARVERAAERSRSEGGQATAEYALVLLGVAAIAMLIGVWASKTGTIGKLLGGVVGKIIGKFT